MAQLVARLTGGQEAAGSSPVTRTIFKKSRSPYGYGIFALKPFVERDLGTFAILI